MRLLTGYRQGEMEMVSPQLAYTFEYDARREAENQPEEANLKNFAPAVSITDHWNTRLSPRPINKTIIQPAVNSCIIAQGVLLEPPQIDGEQQSSTATPAKRIYYDLTAPRYVQELIALPKPIPSPRPLMRPDCPFRLTDTLYRLRKTTMAVML